MRVELPLCRGNVDALVALREGVDPAVLVDEGPRAAQEAAPQITAISIFLVGARGEIALEADRSGEVIRPPRLHRSSRSEALRLLDEGAVASFIGATADGTAHIAISTDPGRSADRPADRDRAPSRTWAHLRWCGHLLDPDESALAVSGVALAAWHASYRFCSRCASPVRPVNAGWASLCEGCGALEFPRHDPAIIVLVIDGEDRALLAHNTGWAGVFASTIAGFVEAGESPDLAVAREVMEEVGIAIRDLEYVGTQPWPFPRSQMLGYTARTVEHAPVPAPDGVEIAWASFYSRDELARAIAAGELEPPGRASIAYAMLREWYGGELPLPPDAADPLRPPA